MEKRPLLLDLFCKAGGCSVGYGRAGFDVVGCDIEPQKNYPFKFVQADALELLADPEHYFEARHAKNKGYWYFKLSDFAAIHASPPCQAYSDLAHFTTKEYPRLIEPIRELLIRIGKPWIIENVEGAPLQRPAILCGTMFGLKVIRHRLFETSFLVFVPPHARKHPKVKTTRRDRPHFGQLDESDCFVSVTGGGNCSVAAARSAMGIDWMTKQELNQAIPPAYTEFIGRQLIDIITSTSERQ